MSARKWPIYSMEVGATIVVDGTPKSFLTKLNRYGNASGKRFSCRRVRRYDDSSPKIIRRLA